MGELATEKRVGENGVGRGKKVAKHRKNGRWVTKVHSWGIRVFLSKKDGSFVSQRDNTGETRQVPRGRNICQGERMQNRGKIEGTKRGV